jgi:flagellar hook protein FlgE
MWTSVSGLLAHGERMNVIGNNISNVNTVGFKGQRMDFQDYLYQYAGTSSGIGQIGAGTTVGIIMNDFSQGSFETTTSATDIAISGNGFFQVSPKGSSVSYYTRAGNFSFDASGYLVDPNGYVLQGWKIEDSYTGSGSSTGIVGAGSPQDILLDQFTCIPKHTTSVTMNVNLATDAADNSTNVTDPFFALLGTWDATQDPPLGDSAYAYQSTIEVYDEAGNMHKLTVYFDKVGEETLADGTTSESYWEYVITMDPDEDVRDFASSVGDITTNPNVPDQLKGLLGAGTITFNSTGQMTDMTCFVPDSAASSGSGAGTWWTDPDGLDNTGDEVLDLSSWVAAPISSDGYPLIAANFSGSAGLSTAYGAGDYTRGNVDATGRLIEVNLGLRTTTGDWSFSSLTSTPSGAGGLVSAADLGDEKVNITGLSNNKASDGNTITSYGTNYFESRLQQDGYTYGDLRSVYVDSSGILSATYSNGVTKSLYQITLYNFPSEQNLRREGNNLFSETAASGVPTSGAAGTGTFGTTESYSLEQSNVDLSREFVNMIATQRGFQANSKSITTVDTMLETIISMKR